MNSTSFNSENSGTQVGINHGPITQNYFSSATFAAPERQEAQRQNTDNEILESLAFPQMLDRRDNIEPCHTNTCKWILDLEEYQSWRSQSHGLLWIKGKPGAGKSTLMVFLHDKLQISQDNRPGIRLDFFFNARGTEMQRTPLGMLRSLLNQIFDRDPTVRSQIREIYDRRCKQFGYGKRQWEWPQVILEELLASAILASASRQHVVVFVDALDEAGAKSAQQLAGYFHRLVGRAEGKKLCIQICISCRHYPIMESGHTIEIKVEEHNQRDIARYIQDKLTKTEAKDITSQKTREMLVRQLTQQANGVFQWVHIMIPLIEQKIREGESFDDICCWLHKVPAGLKDVYAYILNNVIEKSNREQSFLFFQWICLAERPLTVAEMRYALVAQNVREPLSPKKWERISGFIENNEHMLRRIKALSGGLSATSAFKETKESLIQDRPLIHYATKNLFIHAEKAVEFRSNVLHNEMKILQRVLSPWVEIYQKIGGYGWICPPRGTTLLHMAAAANLVDLIECLSLNLEDVTKTNEDGDTAFHLAAQSGHLTVGKILRAKGADQDTKDHRGNTPLYKAASAGHIGFVEWLLDEGVNLKREVDGGALQAASLGGYESVVQILLEAGADVNAQGGRCGNALQAAAWKGSSELVQILLRAGADVNAQGVQILLRAGADVNAQGGTCGNALQAAAWKGSSEILQILLGAGADVNAQGGEYGSPLLAAIHEGHIDEVQLLLHAGAIPLLADELGCTPLHVAASKNMLHILRRFPQLEPALDTRNDFLQTPLHLAVCHGHISFATALLNTGADPSISDGYGRHVMDWASNNASPPQGIHDHCSDLALTPPDTQELTVHRSLLELTESLQNATSKSLWPILQQLGRYFMFIGQFDNARYLFQLHLLRDTSSKKDIWQISCSICKCTVTGTRFVCKLCACIDLCSSCVQRHRYHSRLHPNKEHEVFEVSNVPDKNPQLTGLASERIQPILNNLVPKHLHENDDQSEKELLDDTKFALARRKKVLVPKTAFSFPTIMSGIIFGILALLLRAWYI
ncbi:hypothetical protein N7516_008927 [Penicillium verrucosum]|uniref:uncharacterized protein n=1 Tax=Penicillium verrucosum TaxID=60171 RepID=UPI0025455EF0|nr:uncharacterized protein N7516_008927 [Penicillium verrucosum]KAJ5927154.1 hypothetical protein N7516_008927 [Penicillium verrucosum]